MEIWNMFILSQNLMEHIDGTEQVFNYMMFEARLSLLEAKN